MEILDPGLCFKIVSPFLYSSCEGCFWMLTASFFTYLTTDNLLCLLRATHPTVY